MRRAHLLLLVLCACSSFGKGESTPTPTTNDGGTLADGGVSPSPPQPTDGGSSSDGGGDGRVFEKLPCLGAIICETFDDGNLENRGWTRTGALGVVDQKLKTTINVGSEQTAFIRHALPTKPSPTRIRINATIHLLEGNSNDLTVDLFEYRKRGSSTGVYVSMLSTDVFVFGTFHEPTNNTRQQAIETHFETATNVLLVIDYVKNTARFTYEGAAGGPPIAVIELPMPEAFQPSEAELFVGFSYVGAPVGVRYNALFDDVIVTDR